MNETPADRLTFERFSALLKSRFRVYFESLGELELELAQASATSITPGARCPSAERKLDAFSLIFNGPADALLPQGTYRFQHDQMGRFDLFIVPVRRGLDTAQYEAVFNRIIPAGPKPL